MIRAYLHCVHDIQHTTQHMYYAHMLYLYLYYTHIHALVHNVHDIHAPAEQFKYLLFAPLMWLPRSTELLCVGAGRSSVWCVDMIRIHSVIAWYYDSVVYHCIAFVYGITTRYHWMVSLCGIGYVW